MTKELHPGLGSGALRELGLKINKAREHLKEVSAKYNSDVAEAGDMGSVAHINGWSVRRAEDELHGLQQEAWKAVAEFAALSLSSPIEPPAEGLRDKAAEALFAYDAKKLDTEDFLNEIEEIYGVTWPTPQASSEVRELREALIKLSNEAGGMLGLSGVREAIGNTNMACLQLRVDEARALLAPSRQGAGGNEHICVSCNERMYMACNGLFGCRNLACPGRAKS